MSALCLAGYGSSDDDDANEAPRDNNSNLQTTLQSSAAAQNGSVRGSAQNVGVAESGAAAPATRDAHPRASAGAGFDRFAPRGVARGVRPAPRPQRNSAGLPLFNKSEFQTRSRQIDEDDADWHAHRAKRSRTVKTGSGLLSALPAPERPLQVNYAVPPADAAQGGDPGPATPAPGAPAAQLDAAAVADPLAGPQPPPAVSAPDADGSQAAPDPSSLLLSMLPSGQHVDFKTISADEVQAAAPGEAAAVNAIRVAMGNEHVAQVDRETRGKHEPSKRQKQRHQINALFHQAKATELQHMERQMQGTKSKAETFAKYGWS